MAKKIVVKKSPVHGRGLFAKKPLKKGQIIGRIDGVPTKQDGPHVLWLDKKHGYEVRNDLKYINHSDAPNCCYFDDLSVVALRPVKKGEELLHDYNQ